MLKESGCLIATLSVLGWVPLASAEDFVEDFESYEVHALPQRRPAHPAPAMSVVRWVLQTKAMARSIRMGH